MLGAWREPREPILLGYSTCKGNRARLWIEIVCMPSLAGLLVWSVLKQPWLWLCACSQFPFYTLFIIILFTLLYLRYILTLHGNVEYRQHLHGFFIFFMKKYKNFRIGKFDVHICNQNRKCIKMSTNKPKFGPVVLDILSSNFFFLMGEMSFSFNRH